ncbi:GTP cyclohydrolase II [Magnetospira sp. QH-2]|uniref:GTP cyclohydrolase II n=1 Tax=Magnetospira sp. (strain QH-2) TaxID=1288970 RepID=UPI0003E80C67|nr:GTP cyclohydrolase II [Magnetospira sp. QH-2]CCQ75596.1 GTP cyclohydrolase-2 [Magnetospira sp. QH-2]
MPHRLTHSIPASRQPVSLLTVERAVSELRRGRMVAVGGGGGRTILACAAEAATPEILKQMQAMAGTRPVLSVTLRRAAVLGLATGHISDQEARVLSLDPEAGLSAEAAGALADPLGCSTQDLSRLLPTPPRVALVSAHSCESAAVGLTKVARLLPAAVTVEIKDPDAEEDLGRWTGRHQLVLLDAGDVFQYESTSARTLRRVSDAQVPLEDAESTQIIAYRPADGGIEHLAIVIGQPDPDQPVLTRLHSECFTGDLLGSLRCDCGDQLRGAIAEIGRTGHGVLLYLAQEGRGIGLVNKLRAYALQDEGVDTMDANELLGFDADERIYLPAAEMLRQLGYNKVRLLTNNPFKVEALARCNVDVVERVPHTFPSNPHNQTYLATKADKGGHLF